MSKAELVAYGDYRSRLDDDGMLVIHIGSNDEIMDNSEASICIEGNEVPFSMVRRNTIRSKFCYKPVNMKFNCEYQFCVRVPDNFKKAVLNINFGEMYDNASYSFKIKGSRYRKNRTKIPCVADNCEKTADGLVVTGWAASDRNVDIKAYAGKTPVKQDVKIIYRKDINDYYQEDENPGPAGFEITVPGAYNRIKLILTDGKKSSVIRTGINKSDQKTFSALCDKLFAYFRKYGFFMTAKKAVYKLLGKDSFSYDEWINRDEPDKGELAAQKSAVFKIRPLFSIVVPVYRPVEEHFREMIKSVFDQTYENWELCLADAGGEGHTMEYVIKEFHDDRIKYICLDANGGISENTNAAIGISSGDYIVLGDHDDIIRANALYECTKVINEAPDTDIIYSDEDKVSSDGKKRTEPNFKPDFNLELLRNVNYICHLLVFSRRILKKAGEFDGRYDGAQDHDLILRYTEATDKIRHIPKVLYSWRIHANSTSVNPESKSYAYTAGAAAVKAHLERCGLKADIEIRKDLPGVYRISYRPETEPLVSVLIPNKDHADDLDKCISSVERQDYSNYEIIIIENNSTEKETFEYYEKVQKKYDNVRVVFWKDEFNYSKINNFGAGFAAGKYYLLLNNDTEMINENCLRSLVSYAVRPGTGIVGAKLLYEDDTIQHAGVIVGLGGVACHVFTGNGCEDPGYQGYASITREYSAVTAACLLVKKEAFDAVGGLEEELRVAFNDIDFCLKVREKGYLVIYDADAVLHHYESKSRGYEDTPEKIRRFEGEAAYLIEKWNEIIEKGDPYYNPNLSLTRTDYSVREN